MTTPEIEKKFEKLYEEFTGVSIGYSEKYGMSSDVMRFFYLQGHSDGRKAMRVECDMRVDG